MKGIIKSKYAPYFLAGGALILICAWFSAGFYQADEHFQVLEFCSYKMGNLPGNSLPWEFRQKMRASLLPAIAYGGAKIMDWCGLYNPFTLAFLLRLFIGLASWYITCKFCLFFSSKFKTPQGEKLFILMSLFLWFVPYLNVRFTSENVSGITFLYGVYLILQNDKRTIKSFIAYIFAGLLLGVSFFIRFQMIIAIAGITAWLIFVRRIEWKPVFILVISMAVGIGTNTVIDYWFYGEWISTPFNYYYVNIMQHKAAGYGTSPWWFYFSEFIIKAVPPLSIILLIMFCTGIFKNLKDPLVWAIIPFILVHSYIGHKELRFLFPVTFILIYIAALGVDYFLEKSYYREIHRYFYSLSVIICIPLLLYRTIAPAQVSVSYCKFLYNITSAKNTPLFILHNDSDYSMYGLNASFYKNPDIKVVSIDSLYQINEYLYANQPQAVLFLNKHLPVDEAFGGSIKGYKIKMVYCFFPSWVLEHNINNWEGRTQIWSIYQFTKME